MVNSNDRLAEQLDATVDVSDMSKKEVETIKDAVVRRLAQRVQAGEELANLHDRHDSVHSRGE